MQPLLILIGDNCDLWAYIDGLVQDCSISIANALELLQSCTKPSTCNSAGERLMIFAE